MRIGLGINYAGGFKEVAAEVADLERAGLDIVFVPEAYSFDAVSALGYLAASTDHVELASGILQLYTRTPTLTAMTAAGLDYVSDGRFILGLGASGPQVMEGFHGVPYDAPIARTREVIEICRQVWRRETLRYEGTHYTIPLPAQQGTGPRRSPKVGSPSSSSRRRHRMSGARRWPPARRTATRPSVSSRCSPVRPW